MSAKPPYHYGDLGSTCPAKLELECIKLCLYHGDGWMYKGKVTGLTLAEHTKRFCKLVWPEFDWHRWNDMMLEEICKGGTIAIWGPASSGKTALAAVVLLAWYWSVPNEFTGLVSTTDLLRLELRIFGEIKKRFKQGKERYPWLAGNLIDSRQRITTDSKDVEGRDFRNGILGIACRKSTGEAQGLADYAGIKNRFVVLSADEVHTMPSSFLQGANNLKANNNTGKFIALYLGNLVDLETPLGDVAEPDCGWDALADSDKSRVYPTKFFEGRAIQLVGTDSPNFDYPAGQERYRYLIGRKFIAQLKHDCGEGSPEYIAQAGGTIPRSSLANRVITKEVCRKFHAFESITWGASNLVKLYSMDISYTVEHGDASVGTPLAFGMDIENCKRLACIERAKVFHIQQIGNATVEEALAYQAKDEMDRLGIPYQHFFYDGTGRSSFTAAAMRVIGTMIQPVEFGGRASTRPNFMGRKYSDGPEKGELIPCDKVFDKFVTELWFAWRYLIEADQLRDLPEDVAKEGYMRLWRLVAGNKMSVETKKDMKLRLGRSPDRADALVTGIEGARRLGFVIGGIGGGAKNSRGATWLGQVRQAYRDEVAKGELSY